MPYRLDQYLVKNLNIVSRAKAQELIESFSVTVNAEQITKASYIVKDHDIVEIVNTELLRFVSRAGRKLEAALDELGISPNNLRCLDIGQSTGGFTDCLLQNGAAFVIGIDVGSGQIHPSLIANKRLQYFENYNAKDINTSDFKYTDFDLIVMDVSFISIRHILPGLRSLMRPGALLLSLVKPQFELGPGALNKKGVVKDREAYKKLENELIFFCQNMGYKVKNYIDSPILGGDGNEEFFINLSM